MSDMFSVLTVRRKQFSTAAGTPVTVIIPVNKHTGHNTPPLVCRPTNGRVQIEMIKVKPSHIWHRPSNFKGSPFAQSVAYRTWEQEVTSLTSGLGQYYSRGLMIVIATGFIPLSQLYIVLAMVMWESSQWLARNIVRSTGKKNSIIRYTGYPRYNWNIIESGINPFPNNDSFWRPWETSLLKTRWAKEKLLVMSNFSFTHSVFYPFQELSGIFIKFKIVICRLFQFGPV